MKTYAAVLNAMSNPKRLEILAQLATGESSVTALAERVGLSQSALSQHLSKLRQAHLVSSRRDAQTIYYSVKSPAVAAIIEALDITLGTRTYRPDKSGGNKAGK
ncbi:ArsR/SmtB family transcription factor [Rhizobium sp.]